MSHRLILEEYPVWGTQSTWKCLKKLSKRCGSQSQCWFMLYQHIHTFWSSLLCANEWLSAFKRRISRFPGLCTAKIDFFLRNEKKVDFWFFLLEYVFSCQNTSADWVWAPKLIWRDFSRDSWPLRIAIYSVLLHYYATICGWLHKHRKTYFWLTFAKTFGYILFRRVDLHQLELQKVPETRRERCLEK